jgi:DNA-binding MarR family transcriptional regulator
MAVAAVESLERLAQEVFEVARFMFSAGLRGRRQHGDLKEGEFLALAALQQRGKTIVGDLQRELGVLPTQMSRIIRSLESRERPLVACQINAADKRKIDVSPTEEGLRVLREYRRQRIGGIVEVLRELEEHELEALAGIVEHVRHIVRRRPRED